MGKGENAIKMKMKEEFKICARKLWFLCSAICDMVIIMHTQFEVVLT